MNKTNQTTKSKRYDVFFGNDVILVHKDCLRIGKKDKHNSLKRQGADKVIENVKLNGYHEFAPPLLVWQNPNKPDLFDIVDGNLRYNGIKLNKNIIQVRCVVIEAKNFDTARKIAKEFNDPVHVVRSRHSNIEIVIDEMNNYYKDNDLRKDLALPATVKNLLIKKMSLSHSSLNRLLSVLRMIARNKMEENPDFFAGGVKSGFDGLISSNEYPSLTQLINNNKVYRAFTDLKEKLMKPISKNTGNPRQNESSDGNIQPNPSSDITENPTVAEKWHFTITFDDSTQTVGVSSLGIAFEDVITRCGNYKFNHNGQNLTVLQWLNKLAPKAPTRQKNKIKQDTCLFQEPKEDTIKTLSPQAHQ